MSEKVDRERLTLSRQLFSLFIIFFLLPPARPALATEANLGGRTKAQLFLSWPGDNSIFEPVGTGTFIDGSLDFRLNSTLFFSEKAYFKAEYELVLTGGDTMRKWKELTSIFPAISGLPLFFSEPISDKNRLFDLTKVIDEGEGYVLYHRLDRFYLGFTPDWGTVRIGRQALTWGNGFVFNPMDLFNPFAPTDIDREYKVGDDMLAAQITDLGSGNLQLLYVPRRDSLSGEVEWDSSSVAGKFHFPHETTEFDLMGAKHYSDVVAGAASVGYLGAAAWRLDATWTDLDDNTFNPDYLSLVANMDYSWELFGKNMYGFIEFYFNGLGDNDYSKAVLNPDISERRRRGELFVLGRAYLSGSLRVEIHPLFNSFLNVINNMHDPSGVVQLWGIWDILSSLQMTFGGTLYYGRVGSEFGGFEIGQSGIFIEPANNIFAWLSHYF